MDGWLHWLDGHEFGWTLGGRPGMLQFMGWQRVVQDWVTELNWDIRRKGKVTMTDFSTLVDWNNTVAFNQNRKPHGNCNWNRNLIPFLRNLTAEVSYSQENRENIFRYGIFPIFGKFDGIHSKLYRKNSCVSLDCFTNTTLIGHLTPDSWVNSHSSWFLDTSWVTV